MGVRAGPPSQHTPIRVLLIEELLYFCCDLLSGLITPRISNIVPLEGPTDILNARRLKLRSTPVTRVAWLTLGVDCDDLSVCSRLQKILL